MALRGVVKITVSSTKVSVRASFDIVMSYVKKKVQNWESYAALWDPGFYAVKQGHYIQIWFYQ